MATAVKGVYLHPGTRFQISPPEGWYKVEETEDGATFSPSVAPSATCPRLGVLVQDLSSTPLSLKDFSDISLSHLERIVRSPVRTWDHPLAGLPGLRAEYSVESSDDSSSPDTSSFMQAWALREDAAFIVTFSASASRGDYAAHLPTARRAIDSFSLAKSKRMFRDLAASLFLSVDAASDVGGWSLVLPHTWAATENNRFEWCSSLSADPTEEKVSSRVLVTSDRVPNGTTTESFAAAALREIRRVGARKLTVDRAAVLCGVPAVRVRFDCDNGLREGRRFEHVYAVNGDGIGTTVSFATDCGAEEERPFAVFDRIVAHFRFADAKQQLQKPVPAGLCLYENTVLRFGVMFPRGFVGQEGFMGSTVTFFDSPPGTSASGFETSFGVVVKDSPTSADAPTLEALCDMLKQQVGGQEGCHLEKQGIVPAPGICGVRTKRMVYLAENGGMPVRMEQRAAIMGGRAVILSFGSLAANFEVLWRSLNVQRCMESVFMF